MGITERRERAREEVRRKILDAARDLFAGKGYDHVTMRAVAEAIEYSPTAIYHHFEDKDDLVEALCHEDFARLLGALEGQPPPEDPIEWIRQLGRSYAAFAVDHPNHYRFMFMTPAKIKVKEAGSPGDQSFGLLRMAVARAIEGGWFRAGNVDTVAQVLWAGLHGAVSLLTTLEPEHWPHGPAAPDLVEQVIEHGIRGFLAEPRSR
jgi:AcrR family transcriptional regulator